MPVEVLIVILFIHHSQAKKMPHLREAFIIYKPT